MLTDEHGCILVRDLHFCSNCLLRVGGREKGPMIVSRTPLRISLVGGGTDLPDFSEEHGGAVVSTTIDKWIRVVVAPAVRGRRPRQPLAGRKSSTTPPSVEHELVREAMRMAGVPRGVEIVTLADVPSHGTGLGSSSSVTVGVLNALYAFQGVYPPPLRLAKEACEIEIDVLGKPIGRQDQYAAAVGGFNFIEFLPSGGGVRVEPIVCPQNTLRRVQRSLLLFYTGRERSAADVLGAQRSATRDGRATGALNGCATSPSSFGSVSAPAMSTHWRGCWRRTGT